jgi:VWFA-related protein
MRTSARHSVGVFLFALLVCLLWGRLFNARSQPAQTEEVNLASLDNGGAVVFVSTYLLGSQVPRHLIDGRTDSAGWASASVPPPHDLVFAFRGACLAEVRRLVIHPKGAQPPETWAKEFKIEVSQTSPFRDFQTVGAFTLKPEPAHQTFALPQPVLARFVKLRILSNYGGAATQLGEVQIIGPRPPAPAPNQEADCATANDNASASALGPADEQEKESNDTSDTANPLRLGRVLAGATQNPGDTDFYRLRLPPGGRRIVNLSLRALPYVRASVDLLDGQGRPLKSFRAAGALGREAAFSWQLDAGGYFVRLSQPPTAVVLVVDNSGSLQGQEQNLRRAVEQYVAHVTANEKVALLRFSTGVEKLSNFSSDRETLRRAAAKTSNVSGNTALNAAVVQALDLLQTAEGDKAIILFTDGADNSSKDKYSEMWRRLQAEGVRLYAIGLGRDLLAPQEIGSTGRDLLRHLALATNGRSYFTADAKQLEQLYMQISQEINAATRYQLVARAPAGEGRLQVVGQGERLPAEVAQRRVELIFDSSGSMRGLVQGRPKIDVAKEAMVNIIGGLPDDIEVGLRLFGHRRKGDCADTELALPFAKIDKPRLVETVRAVNALGTTPLAGALKLVAQDLAGVAGETTLIVVTDGQEECGGNPLAEVKELNRRGIKVNLQVIGFAVGGAAAQQLRGLARAGNGQFYQAANAEELARSLRSAFSARYEVRDAAGEAVSGGALDAGPLALPEGVYRVVVAANPPLEVREVRVLKNQTTQVVVTKEGTKITTETRVLGPVAAPRRIGRS